MEMRDGLDRVGEVVGAVTTEDILNRIFSEFCIGK
jgi:tRNA modification GTPase